MDDEKPVVRIAHGSPPGYIRRDGDTLRLIALDSPWSAPAQRTVEIDTDDAALAAVTLALWLAWPSPDEENIRIRAVKQVLTHWTANAGGRLPPGREFGRLARVRAIKKMERLAARRIERATDYWRGLWLAAGGGALPAGMLGKRFGLNLTYQSAGGVKGIARARTRAMDKAKSTAATLAAREWAAARPIFHLAVAVGEAGGLAALAGDGPAIRRILDAAEELRRQLPGALPPGPDLRTAETIQFRPAAAK